MLADTPDFVFNFAEGHGISRSREARVPAVLEMLGIPYTGSDPFTMAVTLDKECAKKTGGARRASRSRAASLWRPTRLQRSCRSTELPFPAGHQAGVGRLQQGHSQQVPGATTAAGAGTSSTSCAATIRRPMLLEEYIDGDEVTVGMLGNDPRAGPRRHERRAEPAGRAFHLQPGDQARLSPAGDLPMSRAIAAGRAAHGGTAARTVFHELGCRDVSRIDFRVRGGMPYFLEVNPLPGLNPDDSDLVIMAQLLGWSYERLVCAIVDAALERCRKPV